MNISYNWLRELSGTALEPRELAERLTMIGLAVEGIHSTAAGNDFALDIDLTSNRPDCLSHLGVAREVAALENKSVVVPPVAITKTAGRAESLTSVEVRESRLCPRYAARVVSGVKITPSPEWLVKRLEAIGQRAINNVADITNYVLHEQGQPLHAFDYAKLTEHRIVVRRAEASEKIKTLDGIERELDAEMLVIADAARAVAVAGVMGGEATEISNDTRDVLIESAYFDPASVRRTARLLGLHTEASHRFERGVDYENVLRALDRCVQLICEIAGGTATENAIDVYPQEIIPPVVSLRAERVEALTGLEVEPTLAARILTSLGFGKQDSDEQNGSDISEVAGVSVAESSAASASTVMSFLVPTWRVDVEREEDLIEEVARHIGYEKISTLLPPSAVAGEYQPNEKRKRAMRRALAACGYDEAISYSFIEMASDDRFETVPDFACAGDADDARFVTLKDSVIEGATRMRPTLLPGLMQAVRHNLNHGTRDVRLFETGRIFAARPSDLPEEREALALVAIGAATEAARANSSARELDFFDLKGAFETAMEALKSPALDFQTASVKHLREGQAASVRLPDGTLIGAAGKISDEVAAIYKIKQPVWVAEIDLSRVLKATQSNVVYQPLARYPSVVRDVTFHVGRRATLNEMLQAVADEQTENCRSIVFVDEYKGVNVPADERWITLRFEYRADERTLSDAEVNGLHGRLIETLARKMGARVPEA
ncbi:MAG: phenylalanine--tRNA ligase subunit beta [Pyrinomonadaceae bacterium]